MSRVIPTFGSSTASSRTRALLKTVQPRASREFEGDPGALVRCAPLPKGDGAALQTVSDRRVDGLDDPGVHELGPERSGITQVLLELALGLLGRADRDPGDLHAGEAAIPHRPGERLERNALLLERPQPEDVRRERLEAGFGRGVDMRLPLRRQPVQGRVIERGESESRHAPRLGAEHESR